MRSALTHLGDASIPTSKPYSIRPRKIRADFDGKDQYIEQLHELEPHRGLHGLHKKIGPGIDIPCLGSPLQRFDDPLTDPVSADASVGSGIGGVVAGPPLRIFLQDREKEALRPAYRRRHKPEQKIARQIDGPGRIGGGGLHGDIGDIAAAGLCVGQYLRDWYRTFDKLREQHLLLRQSGERLLLLPSRNVLRRCDFHIEPRLSGSLSRDTFSLLKDPVSTGSRSGTARV
jgi:hypothetical protein